jgi:hypothetical protein
MRLGLVVGFRVFCCDNLAFSGDFQPVLAKCSKHSDLHNALAIGIEQMQRNFEPMKRHIESWPGAQLSDDDARLTIYRAFVEEELEAPKHLAKEVHREYFEPTLRDFQPRTKWSLQNAITTAFKMLDPTSSFKATASLGEFFKIGGPMTNRYRCHLPIQPGEDFACFKNFATGVHEFYHRRKLTNDCWSLFLLDHLLRSPSVIQDRIWSNVT